MPAGHPLAAGREKHGAVWVDEESRECTAWPSRGAPGARQESQCALLSGCLSQAAPRIKTRQGLQSGDGVEVW